jgi:hypothetical protein
MNLLLKTIAALISLLIAFFPDAISFKLAQHYDSALLAVACFTLSVFCKSVGLYAFLVMKDDIDKNFI